MKSFHRVSIGLGLVFLSLLSPWVTRAAQEAIETPSQKTKDAAQKASQPPPAVSKSLEALKDTAKAKSQEAAGGKAATEAKEPSGDKSLPEKKAEPAAGGRLSTEGKRDPFRPMTLRPKTSTRPRENLSPLERFELGQLKVAGIVWEIKEPRAMIEDTAGLGYIVKVGTPIGINEGTIKAIHRNEIVVEESYTDFHGAKKKRDVRMKLSTE
jgi:type IV pilus assembly protein PilP